MIHVAIPSPASPSGALPPLRPHEYLRLCRRAAGLTVDQVVERLRPVGSDRDGAVAMLRLWEAPRVVVKPEALEPLARVFAFDPDVYRQLATDAPDRHPRICRGCGWTRGEIRPAGDREPARAWATDDTCTACLPDERGAA